MKKFDVGWGIVSACNMRCQFCYSADVRHEIRSNDKDLKSWIDFVNRNHKFIDSINYGTGENSLLDEWYDFVEYVAKTYPEIKQAVTTNGTLYEKMMKNSRYEKVVNEGLAEIDISLDYANAEAHDTLRGLKGAHNNAVNLLNYLKDKTIEATMVFIGINDVLKEQNLEGLFDIAAKADCKLRTNIFRPMNINDERLRPFIADYSTLLNLLKWVDEKHQILYLGDPLFSSILTDGEPAKDPSGLKSIRILSNGDITPSTYLIEKEFRKENIKTASLETLEFSDTGMNFKLPDACSNCSNKNRCGGGVLDRRYLWYKTFNERDPYCPFRKENYMPDFKVRINPNNQEFSSVHKDYLPTLFFKA